ncbi:NAD(P)/FAD-dependent oxidoreductase [Nocardia fluminea]|uniref:NAD(P)/FAD-dependent oxidoreductase n=1 Tax=Nocardia fluminea TaxID=134984 RepID=UPI003D0E634A
MTEYEADLVVVGGGVAALWSTRLAAQAGMRTVLVTSGPLGSHASTRNQGWLHSGGFYAAYQAWSLARACAIGSADIRVLAQRIPQLLARTGGIYLVRDDHQAETISMRLRTARIEHHLISAAEWPYPALQVADCAVDTTLLIKMLVTDAVRAGARIIADTVETAPTYLGGSWTVDTGRDRVHTGQVVLALGAGIPRYLRGWHLDENTPDYSVTRSTVVVIPELTIAGPVIPLFDFGPTILPIWHRGRYCGATMCLPFDNAADGADGQSTDALLGECVDRLPELGARLTPTVRRSIRTYRCEKLLVGDQQAGTEASRTHRIDHLADGLIGFYAGKFSSASVAARDLLRTLTAQITPHHDRQPSAVLGALHIAARAAVAPIAMSRPVHALAEESPT